MNEALQLLDKEDAEVAQLVQLKAFCLFKEVVELSKSTFEPETGRHRGVRVRRTEDEFFS